MSWNLCERSNFRAFVDSLSIFQEETIWVEKLTQISQSILYSKDAVYHTRRNKNCSTVFKEDKYWD